MKDLLQAFLPSTLEVEEMDREEFKVWVSEAKIQLMKRAEQRDPLLYLKKRIPNILEDRSLTEVQKETQVLYEIQRYERIIYQSR